MAAKKATIVTAAALAGACMLALRSLGPKLHGRCRSACAGKCGSEGAKQMSAQCKCQPWRAHDAAEQANEDIVAAGASLV